MKNYLVLMSVVVCGLLIAGCGSDSVSDEEFLDEVRASDPGTSGNSESGLIDPDDASPPSIHLPTQEFEMGLIPAEGFTFKEMPVYNRGGADLVIAGIKTSCVCTTAKMKNDVIPAGGVGTMIIKLDPMKVAGFRSRKRLTISSNDPANPQVLLYVTAQVDGEFNLSNSKMVFDGLEVGESAERTIRLTQVQSAPIEFKTPTMKGAPDFLSVDIAPAPASEWASPDLPEHVITAKVSTDNRAGSYNVIVTIGIPRKQIIRIPIKFVVKGIYGFEPADVTVRNVPPGEIQAGVTVLSSKLPLEILGVKSSNPNLKISYAAGSEPNTFVFDLVVPERPENRLQKDEVVITFKVDGKEVVEVIKVVALLSRQ